MPASRQCFRPDDDTMAFQAEILDRTGVRLSGQEARILRLMMRPHGVTMSLIDLEEWPDDEGGADTYNRIHVVKTHLRKKLAGHVAIETFYGGGYRARWLTPQPKENTHESPHYRRAS